MALTQQQKKIITYFFGFILLIIFIAVVFRTRTPKPITLQIWGFLDDTNGIVSVFPQFQSLYPNIYLNFVLKDSKTYHEDLKMAFLKNKAPDIFMLTGTMIPKYQDKIAFIDLKNDKTLNLKTIQEIYPDIVLQELVIDNRELMGIPFSVDTLALFYNKDIFNHYNIPFPPKTWEEIISLIPQFRIFDKNQNLRQSAIALGTENNINWSSDIFTTIALQFGAKLPLDSNSFFDFYNNRGSFENALDFYTQFSQRQNQNYTWDEEKANSLINFAYGKVAMVLGYERAIPLITSQNPQLNFGVVPFPSFKNRPNVNFYGSTILFVVNKNSPHLKESLAFLKYLSSANASEKYFLSTQHPPARRDLIQKYLNDPLLNAFISQILASKSYYQFDSEAIQNAFKEMIFNARKKNFPNYENISRTFNTLNYLWRNPPSD